MTKLDPSFPVQAGFVGVARHLWLAVSMLALLSVGIHAQEADSSVPPDETSTAQALVERAASHDVTALIPLAFAYFSGSGVPQDVSRATDLMKEAVEAHVEGANGAFIGLTYGIQSKDPERAAELFQWAVDAGVDEALVPLGFAYRTGNGVSQDVDKAVDLITKATKAGVQDAGGVLVGVAYGLQAGDGVPKDPEKAAELFQSAVDAGVKEGLVPLGFAYSSGTGVPQDMNRAADLMKAAVEAHVEGANGALIGLTYGIQSNDPARAAELFQWAVDAGVDEALVPLGFAYQSGKGVPQDIDKAVDLITKATKAGVKDAGGALIGVAYGLQAGAAKNPAKAAELFQLAVDAGVNEGLVPLGFAYSSGNGVPQDLGRAVDLMKTAVTAHVEGASGALIGLTYGIQSNDPARAAELFQWAADAGIGEALVPLGFAYRAGKGVPQDIDKAVDLITKATEAGVKDAGGALIGLAYGVQAGEGAPKNPEKAAELFQLAVDAGVNDGLVPLGFAYFSGTGVQADPEKALALFSRAASARVEGAGNAMIAMAYAYQAGSGLPSDPNKAVAIFKSAADAGSLGALVPLGYASLSGKGAPTDKSAAFKYFQDAIEAGQQGGGTALRFADANEYIRVLQKVLIDRGFLNGRANGLADTRTIRGFMAFCRQAKIANTCALGPLDPVSIEAFVAKLAPAKDASAT